MNQRKNTQEDKKLKIIHDINELKRNIFASFYPICAKSLIVDKRKFFLQLYKTMSIIADQLAIVVLCLPNISKFDSFIRKKNSS